MRGEGRRMAVGETTRDAFSFGKTISTGFPFFLHPGRAVVASVRRDRALSGRHHPPYGSTAD